MAQAMVGSAQHARRARRDRTRLLGEDGELRLTGHRGSDERGAYLRALADDVTGGRCSHDDAVAELEQLSANWLRGIVQCRLRQLPPHVDRHTTEHWMWVEWHASLRRFDPSRVETFAGYVALRLRMAVAAAAREDDDVPRRQRVRSFEQRAVVVPLAPPRPGASTISAHDPADAVVRDATARAVRAVIAASRSPACGQLLRWLDAAKDHDRHPPRQLMTALPRHVRRALASLGALG
jgi:hypothetical protein